MVEAGLLAFLLTMISALFLNGLDCSVNAALLVIGNLLVSVLVRYLPRWFAKFRVTFSWAVWYGGLALCAALCWKPLGTGVGMVFNALLKGLNQYYGLHFYSVALHSESDANVAFFMILWGALFAPLFVWNGDKRQNWWLLAELTVIGVICGLMIGRAPDTALLCGALFGLVLYRLLAVSQENGGVDSYGKWTMAAGAALTLIAVLVIGWLCADAVYSHHNTWLSFQKRLENRLGFSGFTGYTDGNLTNQAPTKTHQTMLRVTLQTQPGESLYLRGFTGENYDGKKWSELSVQSFYRSMKEAGDSDSEISLRVLQRPFTILNACEPMWENGCSISYVGVSDTYAYAPYYASYDLSRNDLTAYGDGGFTRNSSAQTEFRMSSLWAAMDSAVFLSSDSGTITQSFEAGGAQAQSDELFSYAPSVAQSSDAEYAAYVAETYLTVPESLRGELTQFLGTDSCPSRVEAIALVREKLSQQCAYSQTLDNLSWGEDYVEHFLFVEKEGYCCHFATAATLLFRSLGIPARYVTGFCVSSDEFEQTSDFDWQADVKDDCAHAWTEIYDDALGWVPVEVTPGYETADTLEGLLQSEQAQQTQQTSEDGSHSQNESVTEAGAQTTTAAAETTAGATTAVQSETAVSASSKQGSGAAWIRWLRWPLALCLLLFLALVSVGQIRRVRQKERWQADCARAVEAVRRQTMRHLARSGVGTRTRNRIFTRKGKKEKQRLGTCEEGETEQEYFLRLLTAYWEKKTKKPLDPNRQQAAKRFYGVLEKAAYSGQLLDKSDVVCANEFYDSFFKAPIQ